LLDLWMIKVKVEVASNEELVRMAATREIRVLSSLRKREKGIDWLVLVVAGGGR